ncbi:unnamed protein product [Gordionus sp. m RMFG-2023]|uniref:ketosamine-3-kinase-like isoform X2 n=1 Tax=Gordionus sp. m RMFG-2023 TaxID=3053472 RepID=UPI0030DFAF22
MKFEDLKNLVTSELNVKKFECLNKGGGGCINTGESYITDIGKIFIKSNDKEKSDIMFQGEFKSLLAIMETNTVKVPKPIKIIKNLNGNDIFLIMEYIDIERCKNQKELGSKLAKLHIYNKTMKENNSKEYVKEFGFSIPTCCGFLPQNNHWSSDWIEFFIQQKLEYQINMIDDKHNDKECISIWSQLKECIPKYFDGIIIEPSLLHGDLWSGNIGQTPDGDPVIFDPASFYGHHEYDLGIAGIFGGFNEQFYKAYHKVFPKMPGFDERHQLYQLFHYLNHWNHFGGSYRSPSINIMKKLIKDY